MKILFLALGLLAFPALASAGTTSIVMDPNPVKQILPGGGISVSPGNGKGVVTVSTTGAKANGEIPSGTIDGSNPIFGLAHAPAPNTPQAVSVFSDGIRINPSGYTVAGTVLTFNTGSVNVPINTLLVDYAY